MNFMNVELIGEQGDIPCSPTRTNMVVETKYNGFKLAIHASFVSWILGIVFPDEEKALYFKEHFEKGMLDYREGMFNDDYVFHVIHFSYPRPKSLYADQIKMYKNFEPYEI